MNRLIKYILGMLLIMGGTLPIFAQSSGDGYNPDNPSDPTNPGKMVSYVVTLASNISGAGTLTGANTYTYGATATIKAAANTGYKFLYWLKDEETEPYNTNAQFTYTVGMANVNFTAVFEKLKTVTVSVSDTKAGTVSGGGTYAKGTDVTLKATANQYYTFLYWTKYGSKEPYNTNASFTYTVGNDNVVFLAVYQAPPTITLLTNSSSAGTVSYSYALSSSKVVTLIKATANSQYAFDYWLKNEETEPYTTESSFYYEGTENASFTAVFKYNPTNPSEPAETYKLEKHDLNVSINNIEAGVVSGAGRYQYGKSVTISTSANDGYTFVKWQKDGEDYGTSASFSYTIGTEDVSFEAIYVEEETDPEPEPDPEEPATPTHKVYFSPSLAGSCTFDQVNGISVEENANLCITAIPGTDFVFKGWYKNGVCVSEAVTYTICMGTEDITLTALCEYVPANPDDPNNSLGYEENAANKTGLGDVNADDRLSIVDLTYLISYLNGSMPQGFVKSAADVNKDGSIDTKDIIALYTLISELE